MRLALACAARASCDSRARRPAGLRRVVWRASRRGAAASPRAGAKLSICSFCVRATSPCCASSVRWKSPSVARAPGACLARCARPRRAARARALRRSIAPGSDAAAGRRRDPEGDDDEQGEQRRRPASRKASAIVAAAPCAGAGARASTAQSSSARATAARPALGEVERRPARSAPARRRASAPASIDAVSLTARPATMRSPKPPAPMNAAIVAVPTLITAAVLMPARMRRRGERQLRRGAAPGARVRPSDSAASRHARARRLRRPACVLRTIGSSA